VSGAGCPRVTHPFAALPSEGLPLLRFPLDLHVLGTPPAFVLSQDQTLRREPLDPAPSACSGPVFGFVVGKSASPGSTPGSAFLLMLFRTTVEPAGAANRTSRDQRGERTGFWHTVQFSRCERRPEGRDSKEWGRATHHGRHARPGRQPRPLMRPPNASGQARREREPLPSRAVAVDRNERGSRGPRPSGADEGRCTFDERGGPATRASRRDRRPAPLSHRMSGDVCVGEGGISMVFGTRAQAPAPGPSASSRSASQGPTGPTPLFVAGLWRSRDSVTSTGAPQPRW
jgi:hypothetical protein